MLIGFIGLALIAGATAYLRFRSWCVSEDWLSLRRQCAAERVCTKLSISLNPRVKSRSWNHRLGIAPWNPAMMIACGFDPRIYRPHSGDSDRLA